MNILTLTTAFPNPLEPGFSSFVRSRILHMAQHASITVVAPVAMLDYANPDWNWLANWRVPYYHPDGPLSVYHPRWLYPPLGTPLNPPCLAIQTQRLAGRLHAQAPFDVIDSHFGFPDGAAAVRVAAQLGIPCFITLRGNELVFAASPARRAVMREAFRQAAGIIPVSAELRDFALSLGVPSDRCLTIPNGVDDRVFHPRDRAALRDEWVHPPGRLVILSAGRLSPGKGHEPIVRAIPSLLAKGHDVELWIAGSDSREGRSEQSIRQTMDQLAVSSRVRLLGTLTPTELACRMTACDLLCLNSSAEGWPNVIHEAQACGAPAVATRVGAVPQMLPSEDLGIIIQPLDQESLEDGLHRALQRTWNRDAISAHGRARSWDQVAREVIQFMRDRTA